MDIKGKKRFEVKRQAHMDGTMEQGIFVDGELFDWEVDDEALEEAYKMGPEIYAAAQKDIEKHFVESLSEFIHRHVTMEDVAKATQTGWI